MIVPVCILFFLIIFLFLRGKQEQEVKSIRLVLGILWIVLVFLATFRPENMADRENYIDFWKGWGGERFEIGFVTLSELIRTVSTNEFWFLFVFAGLSIALKLLAISKMTKLLWASLLIYVANIYILHDMIQMRCAIASGLLLHAIYFIVNRNLKYFLLIFILAFFFHYSSLCILPLWFLNTKYPRKFIYILLIFLSYAVGGILPISNLIGYIPISGIQNLWDVYENTVGDNVNIFNAMQLGRIAICVFLLLFIERISKRNKYAIIMVKIYAISISTFVLFSNLPVLASRVSELYQIVEIILIPMIMYAINNTLVKRIIVVIIGLSFLLMNIFYLELLK